MDLFLAKFVGPAAALLRLGVLSERARQLKMFVTLGIALAVAHFAAWAWLANDSAIDLNGLGWVAAIIAAPWTLSMATYASFSRYSWQAALWAFPIIYLIVAFVAPMLGMAAGLLTM